MTPKEKAKQLNNKFRKLDLNIKDETFVTKKAAKQYALLCVDELLEELKWLNDYENKDRVEYWQKVKDELHQL